MLRILFIKENGALCSEGGWDHNMLNNHPTFNFTEFGSILLRYTKENMAMVSVYIREPFAEVFLVDEDTSIMDFISSIGGLLGLCMGFSFVSVAEILYYSSTGIFGYITGAGRMNDVGRRVRRKEEALKANSVEPF